MTGVIVVLVTSPTEKEARMLARKLVVEGLAQCVNITPVTSFFEWKGKVEEEKEQLLVMKASEDDFDALAKRVEELHSYDVPEIIALPAVKGFKPYLDWVLS